MIEPKKLCRQHLLGEHFEIHKAVGNLKHSKHWTRGLTAKGFLEPQNFKYRHNELVKEMKRRGFNHHSILIVSDLVLEKGKVNINKSKRDLILRCKECRKNLQ